MAESVGNLKAAILIRMQGSDEPIELGTVELPVRAEHVADGQVQCAVDTSVFKRFAKALAAAIEDEQPRPESAEVFMARRRLMHAQEALAHAQERVRPDDGASQLDVRDATLDVMEAQAELKRAHGSAK